MKRKWRNVFNQDYDMQYFAQCWGGAANGIPMHDSARLKEFTSQFTDVNRFSPTVKEDYDYKPNPMCDYSARYAGWDKND